MNDTNTQIPAGEVLARVHFPEDVRACSSDELLQLCGDVRQFIIDNVAVHGGHLGASLGVVELTVALHYVLNTPHDQLVWDTGHQAYGHKLLTGRRGLFHTNRCLNGLSGFPNRSESAYDAFGVGHSSTSISAALGMGIAAHCQKDAKRRHVAVIGDGAMTAGLAFEAMNHAGSSPDANLLIILNDNCMSIDPNVGALKEYLTSLSLSPTYNKVRHDLNQLLEKFHPFGKSAKDLIQKVQHVVKGFVTGSSNFFEELNLRYFGPIDGHNLPQLLQTLGDIKDIPGPKLLHCLTVKGKGFPLAEKHQTTWHAPGTFDKITGKRDARSSSVPEALNYQEVFGHTLVELAHDNTKIAGITPAMPSGSSMNLMMEAFPDRAFDVGIAEQHAVTFSAGLVLGGMVPFCNVYSSFMQRGYDQIVHDVCIQELPVNFCLDRAGLVGADGATHHGVYDMAYLRCLPGVILSAPMDEIELRHLMYTAQLPRDKMPFFIRYPRGKGVHADWRKPMKAIPIGKGRCLQEGEDLAVLSIGHVGNFAKKACKRLLEVGISAAHYDMRFVKPLDTALLRRIFKQHSFVMTVEDGCLMGGFGSAVLEFMANEGLQARVKRLGTPDKIIEHGTQAELYDQCQYSAEHIYKAGMECVKASKFAVKS